MKAKFWDWFWKTLYPWITSKFVPWFAQVVAKEISQPGSSLKPMEEGGLPPPPPPVPPRPPQ